MTNACIFCRIVARRAPARMVREWPDAIAFRAKPEMVPDGHILVVPRIHVDDAAVEPKMTGMVAMRAAEVAQEFEFSNITFANGGPASQSVFHMHAHVLRRTPQDGLLVPWGTMGNPYAPHACGRALKAEEQLAELGVTLESLHLLAAAFGMGEPETT